ncbi:uncharacterized protein LOC122317374 [Carya illinoinensis]|uniref:DUF241 domain protein n=1 Tax=Carya illinoinensis TaxID=32201 RepID=A0A8T1Q5D9_CARIL|nr:uncharacterized protein LOC122317374 [Carya illinoinensis]KAG6648330.1 hypothetical protein CIPAW_07G139700 [Carya illinoinensis]
MVGRFRRSLSFPNKINPNRPVTKPPISYHIRSVSLPCRSHPLVSQLKDEIIELKSWVSKPDTRTSAWLCDGLSRLKNVIDYLDDILQLPQAQETLRQRCQSLWVEKLLEDFLRFVDVYGIFRTSVLALKEVQSAAQVAMRKRDESKVASYVKSRKQMAKEMGKLVSTVRNVRVPARSESISVGDAELMGVIGDVIEATVTVSVTLFNGISASFTSRKSSWVGLGLYKKTKKTKVEEGIAEFQQVGVEGLWGLRKKAEEEVRMALKKMQDMEVCIGDIENGSERVFRSLINARVSLLNALTQ